MKAAAADDEVFGVGNDTGDDDDSGLDDSKSEPNVNEDDDDGAENADGIDDDVVSDDEDEDEDTETAGPGDDEDDEEDEEDEDEDEEEVIKEVDSQTPGAVAARAAIRELAAIGRATKTPAGAAENKKKKKRKVTRRRARNRATINFKPYLDEYMSHLALDTTSRHPKFSILDYVESIKVLLEDRGYDPPASLGAQLTATPPSFITVYLPPGGHRGRALAIILHLEPKLGVKLPRRILGHMRCWTEERTEPCDVLLLSRSAPSSPAKHELDAISFDLAGDPDRAGPIAALHRMRLHEIRRPITQHRLVSSHRLIEELPKRVLVDRTKLRENMPVLDVNKIISRWYGFMLGDIVQSERKFGGYLEPEPYWRIVDWTVDSTKAKQKEKPRRA